MVLRHATALGAIALTLLGYAAATAATLNPIQGDILVNRGNGYRLESTASELKPGDMVVANAGAAAQIFYPDGCSVPVQAGSIVTIKQVSPCASAPQTQTFTGLNGSTLATGALVVGGVVGAFLLLDNNNKSSSRDNPASP